MNKRNIFVVYTLLMVFMLSGCSGYSRINNKIPDDALSRRVKAQLDDSILYVSKTKEDGITTYVFVIKKREKQVLSEVISVINSELKDKQDRISVIVGSDEGDGGIEYNIILSNFCDSDKSKPCNDISSITIWYPEELEADLIMDLEIYKDLTKIKELVIDKKIQKKAEEDNTDWNKVWPELEHIEVYD